MRGAPPGGEALQEERGGRFSWSFRVLGALILLLTLAPVHWVLRQPGTGRFGESAVLRNASNLEMAWWGLLLAVGLGSVLAILFSPRTVRRLLSRAGRALASPPIHRYALVLWGMATILSVSAGLGLFRGLPTLVDGMVTRLQARMMAGGLLSLQLPEPAAAWLIPNTVLTPEGWVSQYPPLPSLLLAGGELLGATWLVFPLLVGSTVSFSTLLVARLFPGEEMLPRLGGLILALSPFLLVLGGGYLSHVPAAAFSALTLYAAFRAREGGAGWALVVGIGAGGVVTTRPLLGLILGVALPLAFWATETARGKSGAWFLHRVGMAFTGGLPFALGLGLYNRHFFGRATRLGYSAAYGPAHDLGFHMDPWGNLYSPLEALGFTAVDLTGLGTYLLETPAPATALVGLLLLLRPRLPRGVGYLLAWALLPVLANFVYWHHGFHLGPRMLYEAAPAWLFLTAMAALTLGGDPGGTQGEENPVDSTTRLPDPGGLPREAPAGGGRRALRGLRFPDLVVWTLVVSLLGAILLIPNRMAAYRWPPETLARITVPAIPAGDPAVVFVHGSWSERISARLQATGMRLDSIETALRRNDICTLHAYAQERAATEGGTRLPSPPPPELDFQLLAESPGNLEAIELTEGNRVLVDPEIPVAPECRREALADGRGIISLAPLLWQGDLPGLEEGRPMFVRDLGPEENRRVLEAFPARRPYVFLTPAPNALPELRDYQEGMNLIWGGGSS
ncbi:MAG: hypothetical protein ACWGSQ_06220 [Longimicrobiales bacterium]